MTKLLALAMAAPVLVAGCAFYDAGPERTPMAVHTAIALIAAGVSDDVIAVKLAADGMAAQPTAEEIVALKKAGASDRVVQAVVTAPIVSVPRRRTSGYWYPWTGWWYPHPYHYGGSHEWGGGHFGGHHGHRWRR